MYNDPYKVLGISPSASDKEVKAAYKELVKKYHPDQYQDNPLSEVAEEKMAEINQAFDEIMEQRRGGGNSGGYYESGNDSNYYYSGGGNTGFNSSQVRSLIQGGNITQAEKILNDVPMNSRDAEWHFLMGSVCYKRGWLNDAYSQFATAAQMNPNNMEYKSALNQMNRQRGGYMAGNPIAGAGGTSPSFCGCCSDLICADCCCEMMGGDLIPCC